MIVVWDMLDDLMSSCEGDGVTNETWQPIEIEMRHEAWQVIERVWHVSVHVWRSRRVDLDRSDSATE